MSEAQSAATYLYSTLTAGTTVTALTGGGTVNPGVYNAVAPQNAVYPILLYQNITSMGVRVVGATRIFAEPTFQLRAVVQDESYKVCHQLLDAALALLHSGSVLNASNSAGTIWSCIQDDDGPRELPPSVEAGMPIREAVAAIRLIVV